MIRKALLEDLPILLEIYENARAYMAKSGNPNQWGKSNPPKETLVDDIHKNRLYVYEKNIVRKFWCAKISEHSGNNRY